MHKRWDAAPIDANSADHYPACIARGLREARAAEMNGDADMLARWLDYTDRCYARLRAAWVESSLAIPVSADPLL